MSTENINFNDHNNINQTVQTMASGDSSQIENKSNPMEGMGYYPMKGIELNPKNSMRSSMNEDPMKNLVLSTGAIIEQEIGMFGVAPALKYKVFIQSPMGFKYCFNCSYSNGCCSSELIIRHVTSPKVDPDISKEYLRAKSSSFCCLCRPTLEVRLADENKFIGKVREPFTCCNKEAEIYNEYGRLKYSIVGDCCQAGLCCKSKNPETKLRIVNGNEFVGEVNNINGTNGENIYKITFPSKATPEEKILIICASIFIDCQNPENDKTPKKKIKQQKKH